jgi:hypothetical protein
MEVCGKAAEIAYAACQLSVMAILDKLEVATGHSYFSLDWS